MSDHHGICVGAGLNVFAHFQGGIEFFSGLSLLWLWRSGLNGHVNRPEAVFVSFEVILESRDELADHRWWNHDTGDDLLWLLHSQQEVDDEFVLSLKNNGTGCEDAAGHVLRDQGPDVRVSDFLTVRTIIRRLLAGAF